MGCQQYGSVKHQHAVADSLCGFSVARAQWEVAQLALDAARHGASATGADISSVRLAGIAGGRYQVGSPLGASASWDVDLTGRLDAGV